jgi:hypothetical protein
MKLPLFCLSIVALAVSSCMCTPTNDIQFQWTFLGQKCSQVPLVQNVKVEISNAERGLSRTFPCSTNSGSSTGPDGATYFNVPSGTYNYKLTGLSATNEVLHVGTGMFVVTTGDISVNQDLTPVGTLVTWTLPANTTVTCQFIHGVRVEIDGKSADAKDFKCEDGTNSPGILLTGLAPGNHTIDLAAHDATGLFYYRKTSTFQFTAGQTTFQQYALEWIVGSLPLKWSFSVGGATKTCAEVGVSQIQIFVRNPDGTEVYPNPGLLKGCLNDGIQGVRINYILANNYTVVIQGVGTNNVLYRSSVAMAAQRTVVAGEFPAVDAPVATPVMVMQP